MKQDIRAFCSVKLSVRGSFTIEAAVVVPITMMMFLAVIFLSIYVHDQVTMTAAVQRAALEQAEQSLTGSFGSAGLQQGMSRQLIRAENTGLTVSGNADSVTAQASGGFTVPVPMADLLTGGSLHELHARVQNHAFSGRRKLLLYKSICDGVQDLTGR